MVATFLQENGITRVPVSAVKISTLPIAPSQMSLLPKNSILEQMDGVHCRVFQTKALKLLLFTSGLS